IDGILIGETTVPPLESMESYVVEMEAVVEEDVRGMTITYMADAYNIVEESNEENNIVSLVIE
ncbi:hypothetical protein DRO64_11310, partial [Candidatus Bathyarchaeota archaeon]